MAVHSQPCRECGCLTCVVGLGGTLCQYDAGVLLRRLGLQEYERAGFVPTSGQTGTGIPLDPDVRPAQLPRQVLQGFKGRR